MRDSERTLKQMSVGDVVDYSIEIYKRNFKKLTTLAMIFYIPFIFIYSLVISFFSADIKDIGSSAGAVSGSSDNFPFMIMAYYITILGMLLVYFVYSLTIKAVFDASVVNVVYFDVVHDRQKDLKSIIKESFGKFKALFVNRIFSYMILIGIGTGLYILAIIILVVAMVGVASYGYFVKTPGTGESIAIVVGLVLIILLITIPVSIVISYFYAKFGMGIHSVVIENKSASEAITRCNDISKKSFWSISLSFILGLLLFFTVPVILSTGVQFLAYFNKTLFIVLSTASQIIWALLNPYITTLMTVIFINQKIKTEGLDLEVKVDRMLVEGSIAINSVSTGDNSNEDKQV